VARPQGRYRNEPDTETAWGQDDTLDPEVDDITLNETAEIDVGEVISSSTYEEIADDPHDRVIHPEADDLTGLDDFDEFDDDHYDRLSDDDEH